MGIIGFALVCGLVIPGYFARHPVHTGVEVLDQALAVLLKLEMFVGAFVACVLDNTVPGKRNLPPKTPSQTTIFQAQPEKAEASGSADLLMIWAPMDGISICIPKA